MSRYESLTRAIKRNRGRLIQSDWLSSLSSACGLELSSQDLLDHDTTASIKNRFIAKLRTEGECSKCFWPKEAFSEVILRLANIANQIEGSPVILFSSVDDLIGALALPADLVLRHVEAVWKVVKTDLAVTTRNIEHGMCLEESQYSSTGEYIKDGLYEMVAWGDFAKE